MSEPSRTPALELADALRARELSASELMDACLAEVDRLNDELNAVVWRDDEAAQAAAREADERLAAGGAPPLPGAAPARQDQAPLHRPPPCPRPRRGPPHPRDGAHARGGC